MRHAFTIFRRPFIWPSSSLRHSLMSFCDHNQESYLLLLDWFSLGNSFLIWESWRGWKWEAVLLSSPMSLCPLNSFIIFLSPFAVGSGKEFKSISNTTFPGSFSSLGTCFPLSLCFRKEYWYNFLNYIKNLNLSSFHNPRFPVSPSLQASWRPLGFYEHSLHSCSNSPPTSEAACSELHFSDILLLSSRNCFSICSIHASTIWSGLSRAGLR